MITSGLIGRDAEVDILRRVISNIKDEGASVLVRGQPGVGKSSILRVAFEIARDHEALVLTAYGIESAVMSPFAGLHQLLRPLSSARRDRCRRLNVEPCSRRSERRKGRHPSCSSLPWPP